MRGWRERRRETLTLSFFFREGERGGVVVVVFCPSVRAAGEEVVEVNDRGWCLEEEEDEEDAAAEAEEP